MTVKLFGVTAAIVRADYFPQISEFTTDSNPTVASVNRFLDQKAGVLEAKLLQESIVAADVDAISTTAAYLWCQATLTLEVAIRTMEAMTQQNPEVLKAWRVELDARWEELSTKGYLALGGGVSAPSEQPDGPTTFIDNLGLDVSTNVSNASTVDLPFHKDDQL